MIKRRKRNRIETSFMETVSNVKIAANQRKYNIIRTALIAIFVASLTTSFVSSMRIPMSPLMAFIISAVCVTGFSLILSGKRYKALTIGITGVIAIYIVLCWQQIIFSYYKYEYLYNYILLTMRNGVINTANFMTMSYIRYSEGIIKNDVLINAMFMIIVLVSFIFVATLKKRITLLPSILIVTALITPPILGELMPPIPMFALMISAFIGIYTLEINFQSINHVIEKTNAKINKSSKDKKNKKEQKKAVNFSHRRTEMAFNRHSIAALFCSIICIVSFMLSALIVPKDGYDIRQKVIDSYNTISAKVNEMDFNFKSPWKKDGTGEGGSAEQELIESNMLSLIPSDLTDTEILKVMTKKPEVIYLRGRIGAEYSDGEWHGTSKHTKWQDNVFIEPLPPLEMELQTFFNTVISREYLNNNATSGIHMAQVNISYLQKSKVFFLPCYSNYNTMSFDDIGSVQRTNYDEWIIYLPKLFPDEVNADVYIVNAHNADFWELYYDKIDTYRALRDEAIEYIGILNLGSAEDYRPEAEEFARNSKYFEMHNPTYDSEEEERLLSDYDYQSFIMFEENRNRESCETYYSYIPPEIEDDITRLSNKLTTPEQNQYEKTMAIYHYLKDEFQYSTAPQESSNGYDDVRAFLFETKRGHCALSATSMAMLLRAQGYATRYCTGFVANTIGADGVATAIIKESDFHAWTEVYFEGIGWIPFDATASTRFDIDTQTEPQTTTTTVNTTAATTSNSDKNVTTTSTESEIHRPSKTKNMKPFLIAALIILTVAAIIYTFIRIGDSRQKNKFTSFRQDEPTKAAHNMYRYILKILMKSKLAPMDGELPQEFAERVDNKIKLDDKEVNLTMLMPIFEGREFGLNDVSDSERKMMLKYTEELYNALVTSKVIWKKAYLKLIL